MTDFSSVVRDAFHKQRLDQARGLHQLMKDQMMTGAVPSTVDGPASGRKRKKKGPGDCGPDGAHVAKTRVAGYTRIVNGKVVHVSGYVTGGHAAIDAMAPDDILRRAGNPRNKTFNFVTDRVGSKPASAPAPKPTTPAVKPFPVDKVTTAKVASVLSRGGHSRTSSHATAVRGWRNHTSGFQVMPVGGGDIGIGHVIGNIMNHEKQVEVTKKRIASYSDTLTKAGVQHKVSADGQAIYVKGGKKHHDAVRKQLADAESNKKYADERVAHLRDTMNKFEYGNPQRKWYEREIKKEQLKALNASLRIHDLSGIQPDAKQPKGVKDESKNPDFKPDSSGMVEGDPDGAHVAKTRVAGYTRVVNGKVVHVSGYVTGGHAAIDAMSDDDISRRASNPRNKTFNFTSRNDPPRGAGMGPNFQTDAEFGRDRPKKPNPGRKSNLERIIAESKDKDQVAAATAELERKYGRVRRPARDKPAASGGSKFTSVKPGEEKVIDGVTIRRSKAIGRMGSTYTLSTPHIGQVVYGRKQGQAKAEHEYLVAHDGGAKKDPKYTWQAAYEIGDVLEDGSVVKAFWRNELIVKRPDGSKGSHSALSTLPKKKSK